MIVVSFTHGEMATKPIFTTHMEVDVWWRGKWWSGGRIAAVHEKTASVVFHKATYGTKWATKTRYKFENLRLPFR